RRISPSRSTNRQARSDRAHPSELLHATCAAQLTGARQKISQRESRAPQARHSLPQVVTRPLRQFLSREKPKASSEPDSSQCIPQQVIETHQLRVTST